MKSPSSACRQRWAIIRRYFTKVFRRPFGSLVRILWPPVIIGILLYGIFVRLEPGQKDYMLGNLIFTWFLVLFLTIFNVYSFFNTLVEDKETGMKSLMLSMGLTRMNYYTAMWQCFAIFVMPIILTVMISAKAIFLDDSVNYNVIITLSVLFTLHLDAYIAAGVSFVTSTMYAFVPPLLTIILEFFLQKLARAIINGFGESWSPVVLFFISYSPYQVIQLFFNQYMNAHTGIELPDPVIERQQPNQRHLLLSPDHEPYKSREVLLSQPTYLLIMAQAFWILAYRIFAFWFEEVCPWQNVSPVRDFCYCLSSKKNRVSEVEVSVEASGSTTNKYFEARSYDSHEVGIRIERVTKCFDTHIAVNDVSFTIYKGETTLLLGHNGAGKSTLMNIILGLLESDDGYVYYTNSHGADAPPSIGVCPQTSILDDDLNIREHLELFNDIKSTVCGSERTRHIDQTIAEVSLIDHQWKRPQELSGGMKRKLSLGIAFVGKSEVLILDEPSSGLDPDSRMFIWNAIRRYRSDRTVLLSSQHMEEADYLGDRIAIMSAGRIVCCGSSVYLNKLFGSGYKLRLECRSSCRKQLLDHIQKHYFDAANPTEDSTDIQITQNNNTDPIVDFVLELRTNIKTKDYELELIRLLEDLENHGESLSVKSYGLKSSSIEDVMLNTSKYFASLESKEPTTRSSKAATTVKNISIVSGAKIRSAMSTCYLLQALMIKHLQVLRSNLFLYLFMMKVALPTLGLCQLMYHANRLKGWENFWFNLGMIFSIIPLIYFPTRERASKFKIMQSTSSITPWIYWLSQILFDLVWMIVPIIAINIFIPVFITKPLVSALKLHGVITLATICFYIASMLQSYCLSNIYSTTRSAMIYTIIMLVITRSIALLIEIIRFCLLKGDQGLWMIKVVSYVGVFIFPMDAYAYFFIRLPARCYFASNNLCLYFGAYGMEREWTEMSIVFIAFFIQIVAYLLLLALIETQSIDIDWYCRLANLFPWFSATKPRLPEKSELDRDVVEESARAIAAIYHVKNPHSLVAAQLSKSYFKNLKIIDNLSFTVNEGECFGLLGVNGAGKTTTFSMLAGETIPHSGRIIAKGHFSDIGLHEYRKGLGYDPQATPEMSLTPNQALYLMARLRGIDESSIGQVVRAMLELLEMSEHADKYDDQLSGGTKRKLALGMSLIGNPAILALDEPTAGVDPFARRGVWQLLKSLRTNNATSIIISSHAMEECEAICDRIAIMARGRLRCIGSFLHLRSKFAKGFTLRVQLSKRSSEGSNQSIQAVSQIPQRPASKTGQQPGAQPKPDQNNSKSNSKSLKNPKTLTRNSSSSSLAATDRIADELRQQLIATIGAGVFTLADKNVNSITFNITDNRVRRSSLFKMMREFRQKHSRVSYMINDKSLEDIFISLAREQQEIEPMKRSQPVQK